uniref:Ribonuclease z n=1 Tax=Triatoma infestans TaxID=30076 RepID=A0A170V9X3_TRIIF
MLHIAEGSDLLNYTKQLWRDSLKRVGS